MNNKREIINKDLLGAVLGVEIFSSVSTVTVINERLEPGITMEVFTKEPFVKDDIVYYYYIQKDTLQKGEISITNLMQKYEEYCSIKIPTIYIIV